MLLKGARVNTARHYLLSLEERLGVHLSAGDSDYDQRKCHDRVMPA